MRNASIRSGQHPVHRWVSVTFLGASLALILWITLFPFDFLFDDARLGIGLQALIVGWGRSTGRDAFLNVLLFIPFGLSLGSFLRRQRRLSGRAILAVGLGVCCTTSYAIEVLQQFQPGRFPSLFDVLANSLGGALGLGGVYARVWVRQRPQLRLSAYGAYIALAFLLSIPLQRQTRLSNWETAFPLLLGNEGTGNRPWRGSIAELYLADRALSEAEVAQAFAHTNGSAPLPPALLAFYELHGPGEYSDRMGHGPPLVWKGKAQDIQSGVGAVLGPHQWLATPRAASWLTQRIMATSQFTLGVMVATADPSQTGPARIVSLSRNPSYRNFTLGQRGDALVFRLRTPVTGKNGAEPELVVPAVFAATHPQHVAISYDGAVLRLYLNGVRQPHTFELTPGAVAFNMIFQRWFGSLQLWKLLYYASLFLPVGQLLGHTLRLLHGRFAVRLLVISVGVLGPALLLEGLLIYASGKAFAWDNLLLSLLLTALGLANHCLPTRGPSHDASGPLLIPSGSRKPRPSWARTARPG